MAIDLEATRQQVIALRAQDPPVSWSRIGEQLGIARSRAQRLFNRKASPSSSTTPASVLPTVTPAPTFAGLDLVVDPDVRAARRQLELDLIADKRRDLEQREFERQQRAQLMATRMQQGGDGGTTMLLMQMIDRLERRLDDRPQQQLPLTQPRSVIDQLHDYEAFGNLLQKFAPPASPNAAVDVAWRVQMAALDKEDRRLTELREKEIAVRQREADSVNMRNAAIAGFFEQVGPIAASALNKYMADHATTPATPPPASLPAAAAVIDQPAPTARGEITGECPVCHSAIGKSTPDPEKCPACGSWLILDPAGRIITAGDTSSGAAPGSDGAAPNVLRIEPMRPVAS